jgi:hypothetical protein
MGCGPHATQCEGKVQKELTTSVIAPEGARWVTEFVTRDKKSNETKIPCLILIFDKLEDLTSHYGVATVQHFVMGTSFRVIQQGMWRHSDETVDVICGRIVGFRHGSRSVAVRTVKVYVFRGIEYSTEAEMDSAVEEYINSK